MANDRHNSSEPPAVTASMTALSSSRDESSVDEDDILEESSGDEQRNASGKAKPSTTDLTATQVRSLNFVMEHRIFLKAILGLLADRDRKATEIGMNDPNTPIKSGPLKKASHLVKGIWKVKYVELRRGMLTYYEDNDKKKAGGEWLRKNVPLDSNDCSCRPVKIHRNGVGAVASGAVFELIVGGGGGGGGAGSSSGGGKNNNASINSSNNNSSSTTTTRRLWLAKTNDERRAWIDAIHDAMVGGSFTQGSSTKGQHGKLGSVKSKSPFKKDLKKYLKVQGGLKSAKTKADYIPALKELENHPLEVPVQWIMEQVEKPPGDDGLGAFYEGALAKGIDQLWRDLRRDSILINNELFNGDVGHGPEKIIGALARNIVNISRNATTGTSTRYAIPESKAFAYARDVLLSINRTRSGGDSYYCIDTLCNNQDLVVITPTSREAEPLSITVEMNDSIEDTMGYSINDKWGWIWTRNRIQRNWRKRYFVLSEGTFSFYRNSTPRPHGLRGQMVLRDANMSVDKSKDKPGYYVLLIEAKDGLDRFLYFNNEDKLLAWAYALELVAKGNPLSTPNRRLFGKKDNMPENIEESMKRHIKRLGLDLDDEGVEERIARLSAKASSQVRISVQGSSEFKIVTMDPQGDDTDTWATIGACFGQNFRITGDRIVRGEETVKFLVTDCLDAIDFSDALDASDSFECKTPRRTLMGIRKRKDT
eukprot:scaffold6276_cov138-Cylindrotheca_fusiformis.AAC.6